MVPQLQSGLWAPRVFLDPLDVDLETKIEFGRGIAAPKIPIFSRHLYQDRLHLGFGHAQLGKICSHRLEKRPLRVHRSPGDSVTSTRVNLDRGPCRQCALSRSLTSIAGGGDVCVQISRDRGAEKRASQLAARVRGEQHGTHAGNIGG